MCLAIPGKILDIKKDDLTVSYPTGDRKAVNTGLSLKKGDFILVQAGIAVQKVPKREALECIKAWKEIK